MKHERSSEMKSTAFAIWAWVWAGTAWAVSPVISVTPYTFLGRVTDASHAAYDAEKSAVVAVYDADGAKLAEATTFHRSDSRRNYSVDIPMSTSTVDGYAVQNDPVAIVVTDSEKKQWVGVVPSAKSIVGVPGGVAEIDIVLSEPGEDTFGIDGDLYWSLYSEWLYSDYYDASQPFDPNHDHDGDGISTLKEAFAGTDPFDPSSKLVITAYAHSETAGDAITFTATGSRAYVVEGATSLTANDWTPLAFSVGDGTGEQTVLSCPSSMRGETPTIYLKPLPARQKFFRIRQE